MNKKVFIITIVICLALFAGCGGNGKQAGNPSETPGTAPSVDNVNKNNGNVEEKNKRAVYTGESITEADYQRAPFMAIIENMKAARPQSGLSDADIVFETMAEGGIPRFMAIFQSKESKKIGPIRSDRPYFNELAESYDLPFAHCGGYQVALDEIVSKHLMSLNEMANGDYFWRDKSRKAPHNLFTSSDRIKKLLDKKNYIKTPEFNLSFDDSYWSNVPDKAGTVTIKFSGYYTTEYAYVNGRYMKTMNGAAVPDKNTGIQLSARNIVIQVTSITPIKGDAKERVRVRLQGKGTGYVFCNGAYKKIIWSKPNDQSKTELTDESGNPIKLSEGNTWWSIMDRNGKVTIK